MRAVIVWKDNTDYARSIIDWKREFDVRTGKEIEDVDPDTREGASFAKLYDVLKYPTILALSDDGREMQRWDGEFLPKIDDVSFYAR